MAVKEEIKSHPGAVDYFKELPFYNKHIEKPKTKCLKKHWFAFWTSFLWRTDCNKNKSCILRICNELQSQITWEKNPIKQLETSKSSIKDLFNDLLNEIKGLKYK